MPRWVLMPKPAQNAAMDSTDARTGTLRPLWADDYEDGDPPLAIAKRMGVSRSAIWWMIRERGLERKKPHRCGRCGARAPEQTRKCHGWFFFCSDTGRICYTCKGREDNATLEFAPEGHGYRSLLTAEVFRRLDA